MLAISWLVLPWTINGKLSAILKVQKLQLEELERIARCSKPSGSTGAAGPGIAYKTP